MIYLLDTNVCVSYLRGRNGDELEARLNAANPGDVALCSVVKAELLYGAAGASSRTKIERSCNVSFPVSRLFRSRIKRPQPTGRSVPASKHLEPPSAPMI